MKDYAQFTPPGDVKPGLNTRYVAIGGVVLVIVLAVVGHAIFKKRAVRATQTPSIHLAAKNQSHMEASSSHATKDEPSFDFYDVLPQQSAVSGDAQASEKWTTLPKETPEKAIKATPKTAVPVVQKPNTEQVTFQSVSDKIILEPAGKTTQAIVAAGAQTHKTVKKVTTTKPTHHVAAVKAHKKSVIAKHYVLQVGLFSDKKHAQQKRAELLLRGLDVTLSTQITHHKKHYVLNMGPYTSRRTAQKHQLVLAKRQIHGKIIVS